MRPAADQGQQHRLAEHQPVARPQVVAHPLDVDVQTAQAAGPAGRPCSGRAATSRAARSARRTSARCPARATGRRPAARPAGCERTTRASPLIVSAEIGLRLWGIADEPFWPGLNPSTHLADLGALEVAQLDGDQLARRRHRRQRAEELGVAVAGDDLGRRHRAQPEPLADVRLDRRVDVGVRADGARTACTRRRTRGRRPTGVRSRSSCSAHSATLAPNVVGSAWMPWVRPIITVSQVRAGELDERAQQPVGGVEHEVGGVAHRPAQRGVDDVRRRQPVVDPRAGRRADALLHDVDERGDVVVGRALALEHGGDERVVDDRRPLPARGGVVAAARRRARRGPRSPAARPPASGRSASCRPRRPPSPGVE